MVEVQFVSGTTNGASPAISFPHCELDVTGDESPVLGLTIGGINGGGVVLSFLDRFQAELEHLPSPVRLSPRVNEVETPVVAPNAAS